MYHVIYQANKLTPQNLLHFITLFEFFYFFLANLDPKAQALNAQQLQISFQVAHTIRMTVINSAEPLENASQYAHPEDNAGWNKDVESRAIAEVGELLLKGWVLLDASCPNTGCYAPLVCTKTDRNNRVCVLCRKRSKPKSVEKISCTAQGTTVRSISREASLSLLEGDQAAVLKLLQRSSPSKPEEESAAQRSPQIPTLDAGFETYTKRRDEACSKIGPYLLQGYCMTDSPCAKCSVIPLLRNPRSGATICVSCPQESVAKVEEPKAVDEHKDVGDKVLDETLKVLYEKLAGLKNQLAATDVTNSSQLVSISEAICKLTQAVNLVINTGVSRE